MLETARGKNAGKVLPNRQWGWKKGPLRPGKISGTVSSSRYRVEIFPPLNQPQPLSSNAPRLFRSW